MHHKYIIGEIEIMDKKLPIGAIIIPLQPPLPPWPPAVRHSLGFRIGG